MAIRASKHRAGTESAIKFEFKEGLNYSVDPTSISDTQCPILYNFYYEKGGLVPVTRPGLKHVTLDATTSDIEVLFHWVKDSTTEYTLMVSATELYYLDRARASFDAWATATVYAEDAEVKNGGIGYTCISGHTSASDNAPGSGLYWETYWRESPLWVVQNTSFNVDSSYRPQFLAFNQRVLIAAGTEGLLFWDGPDDYGQITTGTTTIHPTEIIEIGNRVVINNIASGGYDSVYFSAIEDEEGWTFTSVGGAVLIRADYGRGFQANGFGVFGDDLIVSLSSETSQKLVRISISGDAYAEAAVDWRVEKLFYETGAVGDGGLLVSIDKQVLFMSQNGLEAVTGTEQSYSELAASRVGNPVNRVLSTYTPSEIRMIPTLGSVWMIFSDVAAIFVFHPWGPGFTEIYFPDKISSITQRGDDVLIAMGKYLYILDVDSSADEVIGEDSIDVYCILRTRMVETFGSATLVKRVEVNFVSYTTGTIYLDYIVSGEEPFPVASTGVGSITPRSYGDLYTWMEDFMLQTFDFIGTDYPTVLKSYSRSRVQDFTLQIRANGRCKINNMQVVFAELEG